MNKLPLIFVSMVFVTFLACETSSVNKYKQDPQNPAYLIICPQKILGCANKIRISNTDYLISPQNEDVKKKIEELEKIKGKEFLNIPIMKLEYSKSKEKGHFPNPMAEFDVAKVSKISY